MADTIRLRTCYSPVWVRGLKKVPVSDKHCHLLVGGRDVDVRKPNGDRLFLLRHRAIPGDECDRVLPELLEAARPTDNRGDASGGRHLAPGPGDSGRPTTRANTVLSGVVGFMDSTGRHRYCRTTAFTAADVGRWAGMLPFTQTVDRVFARECPDRYQAQLAAARATDPYYVTQDTAFTTVTVNRNYATTVHRDRGDLPEGFGVITVVQSGEYAGGHLVFPQYGVAVDVRHGDVLLADVHEWHGNTPIVGREGEYERVSCVFYYRTGMRNCLPPAEEYARRTMR